MREPILSFVIPTWNRAQTVYKCVKHILAFEGDEIEVVVSDNASDDNTIALLRSISDKRLKIFKNDFNMVTINWPLAISRATGRWAALMSDEDIVQLNNIPYFINMLNDAERRDFAGVIFSYPPLNIRAGYECENRLKSMIYACFFSGHITGYIVNKKYFKLRDLKYYLGCHMPTAWEVYKRYGEPTEESCYVSDPPVAEPQQEIFLTTVYGGLIKIDEIPLISFGKDIVLSRKENIDFNPVTVGGRSIERHNVIARARLHKVLSIIEDIIETKDEKLLKYIDSSLMIMLLDNVSITALTAAAYVFGKDVYRPAHMELAKRYYHYTISDILKFTLDSAREVYSIIGEYISKEGRQYFDFLMHNLERVLRGEFDIRLPRDMPLFWKIKIGDFFFQILLRIRTTVVMEYDDNLVAKKRKAIVESDLGEFSFLEENFAFIQTNKVIRLLRDDKDYEAVIRDRSVQNFRVHYLRAEAYFKLGNWDAAKEETEAFLSSFETAQTLRGIITGIPSVLYSFFFLGHVFRTKDQRKSIENFAKFYALCDQFLVREMLERADRMLPRKRVLITGTTGFLGRHISDALGKIFDVAKPDRTKLDLSDTVAVEEYLARQKFDVVIHLANPTGRNSVDKQEELFERSLKIFNNLARCSEHYGKMIYIGSGAEYGKQRDIVEVSEETFGTLLPQDSYGLSRYIMSEIAEGKNNIIPLRLFGCCGENDPSYKLIPHIANCIAGNRPILLRENKRFDYLYVEDIAPVLEYMVTHDLQHKAYNLCSSEPILISEIAEEVKKHMRSELPVVFENTDLGLEYTGSNARLKAEIPGWEPTEIREAIRRIVFNEFL